MPMGKKKNNLMPLLGMKNKKQKIVMLTAYDFPFAKILDETGVDVILVGDSLGNVILGYPNTRAVKMEDMLHHTQAVARGVKSAFLVADMPYNAVSLSNARRLLKAGAEGVKIEGVDGIGRIRKIIAAGIPVMGHLGYLPQSNIRPKIERSDKLIEQAKALEKAGAFAIVLEMVEPELANSITKAVKIPTIGIGSGATCDGQVLVTHDLIGLSDWSPSFVKPKINLKKLFSDSVRDYIKEVKG